MGPVGATFHAVVHGRASRCIQDADEWCLEEAWFEHSTTYDFRVIDPPGYIWGLKWIDILPRQWLEITTQSLEAWKQRDETSPFLPDNRRGYARVTPVALSKVGVPDTKIHAMDEYPLNGPPERHNLCTLTQHCGH